MATVYVAFRGKGSTSPQKMPMRRQDVPGMTKGSCLNVPNQQDTACSITYSRGWKEPHQQCCDLRGDGIGSIGVVVQVSWKMVRVSGSLTGNGKGILQSQAAQGSQAGHCVGKGLQG